jgi:hypothetical protein
LRGDTGALPTAKLRNDQPNAFNRDRELLLDEVGRQPHYGETEPTKPPLAAPVSRHLARMNEAIHFHDEAKLSGIEICNEARTHWHLVPELDPECTAANGVPQDLLGPGREGTKLRSALRDELLATGGCTPLKR